ncbi:MAG: hypothetical protein LUD68_09880 [Rikenellaceae bacterium]|nr:hypothetical protein [Rikenellaceae bacterium]
MTTEDGRKKIYPGIVGYRDIRGPQNPDGSYEGRDGIIDSNDQIRLARRTTIGGANMHLGLSWRNFSLNAWLSFSWGGYPQVSVRPSASGLDLTNVPVFWKDMFHFADIKDANGQIVAPANIDGKWPNPAIGNVTHTSSIWHVSSFRLYLNNATLGYTLPREVVEKINIASLRVTLTGTNLISFVNPWPEKYYNQLQGYGGYPTTRVISLGVNIGF